MSEQVPTARIKYWMRWILVVPVFFFGVWMLDASAADVVILCWLCRLTLEIDYE